MTTVKINTMPSNDEINAWLGQMKTDTIDSLRAQYVDAATSDGTADQDTQGKLDAPILQSLNTSGQIPISVYLGENGRGLVNDATRLLANRQNRFNTDDSIAYSAEQHGDPSLPKQWAVVGRRVSPAVLAAEEGKGVSDLNSRNGSDVQSDNAKGDAKFNDFKNPIIPEDWQHADVTDEFIKKRYARAMDVARAAGVARDFANYYDPANGDVKQNPEREIGQCTSAATRFAAMGDMVMVRPDTSSNTQDQQLAWASIPPFNIHEKITAREPIKEDQKAVQNRATYGIDNLQDEQYPHTMRIDDGVHPVESADAARARTNAWIRFNMERSFAAADAKDMEASYFYLGLAKHALQDSTSPMHNDANQEPAIWKKDHDFINHLRHGLGELFDPGPDSWAQKATDDLQRMYELRYVPAGDLTRSYGIDSSRGPIDRQDGKPRPDLPDPRPARIRLLPPQSEENSTA